MSASFAQDAHHISCRNQHRNTRVNASKITAKSLKEVLEIALQHPRLPPCFSACCCPLLSGSRLPPIESSLLFFYLSESRGRLSLPTSNLVLTLRLFPCPSTGHDFGQIVVNLNPPGTFFGFFTVFSCRSEFTAMPQQGKVLQGIVFESLASSAKVTSSTTMQRIFNSPVTAHRLSLRVTREATDVITRFISGFVHNRRSDTTMPGFGVPSTPTGRFKRQPVRSNVPDFWGGRRHFLRVKRR